MGLPDFAKLQSAYMILVFYSVLMSSTATIGYALDAQNGFTYGYLVGIAISLGLWYQVGKKMSGL